MSQLSPLGRAIVDAARDGDRSTSADRARVRAKLTRALTAGAVIGAAGASSSTAIAATKAAALKATWGLGWLLAPAALVTAVGAGAVAQSDWQEAPPERVAVVTPAAMARAREVLASAPVPMPVPASASVPASAPVPMPVPVPASASASVPVSAPARQPSRGQDDPLLAEAQRLREVHEALNGGDPARALSLLDNARAGAQLEEERAAARAVALCDLGKDARAAQSRFLSQYPRSAYAARVRAACTHK